MPATVWKGRLAFGMVSIPVRLYKAARRERIRFHHVYRQEEIPDKVGTTTDESDEPAPSARSEVLQEVARPVLAAGPAAETVARVRNMRVGELAEQPIDKPQVLKGFEIEKDRYVTFEPRELAAVRAQTSTELSIVEFVRLNEIDPIFFETSYYAAPDRDGEKPYALLFTALAETDYAAIGSLAMHGREHATVIRPGRRGLILHTLFYENEVRADEEHQTDQALVNRKELELAKTFIRALAAPFDPSKLKDSFEERLRGLIQSRAKTAVAGHIQGEVTQRAPVVDILEALRKSLEIAENHPRARKRATKRRQNCSGSAGRGRGHNAGACRLLPYDKFEAGWPHESPSKL